MHVFRLLALAWALSALLIAPAWLSAGELPVPDGAVPEIAEEPAQAEAEPAAEEAPAPSEQEAEQAAAAGEPAEEPPAQEKEPKAEEDGKAEKDGKAVARAAASGTVVITDFEFTPASITVNVGDTVTWRNDGPTGHSATANDGSFDTGIMSEGESGSHTFTAPGTISYICTPHPFMTGTVVVQGETAGSDDPSSPAGGGEGAAAPADDGPALPATGSETLLIALMGLATLGSGVLLRRRAEA